MDLHVEAVASVAHGAVRELCIVAGQSHVPLLWEKAPEWERDEMRAEVVDLLDQLDPRDAAERWELWARGRRRGGWHYGPVLNAPERTDPRLTDTFERLDPFHRARFELVAAVVESMLPWMR